MRTVQSPARRLMAIIGALIITAAAVLGTVTMSPTEASWGDRVYGSSTFGTHPDAGKNRARGTAAYGSMTYRVANQEDFAKVEVLAKAEGPLTSAATGPITRSVRGALLNVPASVDGTVCARSTISGGLCSKDPGHTAASDFAQAHSSELSVTSFGLSIVRYAQGRSATPAIATASCAPGRSGTAGLLDGEPVVLGRSNNQVEVPIPGANRETRGVRTWNSVTYTARLQWTKVERLGYAKSELRLHVEADGATGEPWILHVILANAECGLSQSIEENIPQPTATNFRSLAGTATMARVLQQPPPAAAPVEPTESEVSAPIPDSEAQIPADHQPNNGTEISTTQKAPTQPAAPSEEPESASSEPATSAPATSAPATSDAPEPTAASEGPQGPELVRIGREFAVVNREGAELGTARIDDITRTPDCGVAITLSIRTSDEAGTDRWASIGPDDFAEVRPGGSIRKASRVSSDCEQAANSRVTALSAGREYEIVIAIALDDSAQQAMLRPDGTAGWMFDLPPLIRVPVTPGPESAGVDAGDARSVTDLPASG